MHREITIGSSSIKRTLCILWYSSATSVSLEIGKSRKSTSYLSTMTRALGQPPVALKSLVENTTTNWTELVWKPKSSGWLTLSKLRRTILLWNSNSDQSWFLRQLASARTKSLTGQVLKSKHSCKKQVFCVGRSL